jgi:hypothetical protein
LGKNKPPWNLVSSKNPAKITAQDGALHFQMTKGQVGLASGAQFHANPNNIFPTDRVTVSYAVYFPPGFQFVKGGKLPGVCLGTTSKDAKCATGGNWNANAGSFRVMFRENGGAIGYVYLAFPNGPAALAAQSAGFQSIGKVKNTAGIDLWHNKKSPELQLRAGQWNTVSFSVTLNTPGKSDGALSLTVNGQTKSLQNMAWRQSGEVRLRSLLMVAFFGGGSADWASPVDTKISFKDVSVRSS